MKGRQFLTTVAIAAAGTGAAACGSKPAESPGPAAAPQRAEFKWKPVTAWPPNFPGLGSGANGFARTVEKCSNGRLRI